MQCVAIERLPAEMEQTIGLATWNVRFDNGMAVLNSNGNAIVVGDTGWWTYTPRLEQQEDGTYASAFPVPKDIGQLSDAELEKIARDAVADYEAWKASLPPDTRHATERLEKGELIIGFKQDHTENEGQPKRSRERGNESSTPGRRRGRRS